MKIIFETDRLTLSEWDDPDAPFILKLVNTPSWIQHIGDRNIESLVDAYDYIQKLRQSYLDYGYGFYALRIKASNTLIGMCGIIQREGLDDPDIGYALLPAFEGNGYMLEAAKAMLSYAKEKLNMSRVVAITTAANQRSIRLLQKLNFVFDKEVILPDDDETLRLYATELIKGLNPHDSSL
ncbi:MAG: GNAT family N-acetyltransferase [Bacteroidia bacterium]|nr:GNAT family N-acetyltransferase [Bacteroidia bacterium]